jgi:hypothetical protein
MWCKWAQKQNKTQTTIVNSGKVFYELLKSPATEVTNLIFPKNDVAWESWKYSEDNVDIGKMSTWQMLQYVTTQPRLKLYEYLRKL